MAERADLVGVRGSRLLGGAEHALQRPVEVLDHGHPLLLSALHVVQPGLELGRVLVVGDGLEVVDHQRVDDLAHPRRIEAPVLDLHVPVRLGDRLHDGRVRRRTADAALLELFDQRRLGVARWRLAEVLLGLDAVVVELIALRERGQLVLAVLVASPDAVETVEREHRPVGSEHVFPAFNLDLRLVVLRRRHPAGDEPPPDQVVEPVLVGSQVLPDRVRRAADVGRPDRLVSVLRPGRRLGGAGSAEVALTVLALDVGLHPGIGVGGDARRVGAHVGDEADRALGAEVDALVELLGDAHRDVRPHAQAAGRVLLQRRGDVGRV